MSIRNKRRKANLPPISHFFNGEIPSIPHVRDLTPEYTRQIAECLNAGHPMSHVDKYIGRTSGTIGRWKCEGRFDDYLVFTQKELYSRIIGSSNPQRVKYYLDLYDDVNWAPYYRRPLIFSENLELVKALIDRGANVNIKYTHVYADEDTPIAYALRHSFPDVLIMLIKAGADLNLGSIIGDYVRYSKKLSVDCLVTMIEVGADITSLYSDIYNRVIYSHAPDIVRSLMRTGHNIILEQTMVYKIWHNLITPDEIEHVIARIRYYVKDYRIKTEEEKYIARQEEVRPSLDDVQAIIAAETSYAATVRDEIQNNTGLNSDVSYLISKYLYDYTPY